MKLYENILIDTFDKGKLIREKYGETPDQFYNTIDRIADNRLVSIIVCEMTGCHPHDLRSRLESIWLEADMEKTQPLSDSDLMMMKTRKIAHPDRKVQGREVPVKQKGGSPEVVFKKMMAMLTQGLADELLRKVQHEIDDASQRQENPENVDWSSDNIREDLNKVVKLLADQASKKFQPGMKYVLRTAMEMDLQLSGRIKESFKGVQMSDETKNGVMNRLKNFPKYHAKNLEIIYDFLMSSMVEKRIR